jgi:hypothetical protein
MIKRICKPGLFVALLVLATGGSLAQSPKPSPAPTCENSHKTLAPKGPRMGADGTIVPGQAVVQWKLTLDEATVVRVVEHPRTEKDMDSYNSTIIVQRGHERKDYALGKLIKLGSGLRLVETASFCSSPGKKTVFLAFETPSVGASEGFAVIRSSPDDVDVQVLPMADQGRIVVSRADLDRVELWSAKGSASEIECDACKKHYAVQDCEIGQHAVTCNPRAGADEIRSPSKFIGARIEVR